MRDSQVQLQGETGRRSDDAIIIHPSDHSDATCPGRKQCDTANPTTSHLSHFGFGLYANPWVRYRNSSLATLKWSLQPEP